MTKYLFLDNNEKILNNIYDEFEKIYKLIKSFLEDKEMILKYKKDLIYKDLLSFCEYLNLISITKNEKMLKKYYKDLLLICQRYIIEIKSQNLDFIYKNIEKL